MQETRRRLLRELVLTRRDPYLIDQPDVAPCKESVLRWLEVAIPSQLLDIGQRSSLRQRDLAHRLCQIQEARQRSLGAVQQIVIPRLARSIIHIAAQKRIERLRRVPSRIHKAES